VYGSACRCKQIDFLIATMWCSAIDEVYSDYACTQAVVPFMRGTVRGNGINIISYAYLLLAFHDCVSVKS